MKLTQPLLFILSVFLTVTLCSCESKPGESNQVTEENDSAQNGEALLNCNVVLDSMLELQPHVALGTGPTASTFRTHGIIKIPAGYKLDSPATITDSSIQVISYGGTTIRAKRIYVDIDPSSTSSAQSIGQFTKILLRNDVNNADVLLIEVFDFEDNNAGKPKGRTVVHKASIPQAR